MSKEIKSHGSIIYKLLIVVLAVALVFTIIYPKQLWEQEEANQKQCRKNMEHILIAEYVYFNKDFTFNDTLANVIDYIVNDSTGANLRYFTNVDSAMGTEIIDYVKSLKTQLATDSITLAQAQTKITSWVLSDSTLIDSTVIDTAAIIDSVYNDYISKQFLTNNLIDSLRYFGKLYDIDTTNALILDSLRYWPEMSSIIDSMGLNTLDNIFICPTSLDTYRVEISQDSVNENLKFIHIFCPLDSEDSLKVANDFVKNKLGGLKIKNHGYIDNGTKSWSAE